MKLLIDRQEMLKCIIEDKIRLLSRATGNIMNRFLRDENKRGFAAYAEKARFV